MLRNEKGIALPTVILIMVILTMIGMSLLAVSANQAMRSTVHEKKVQAYYIARSGVDAVAQYLLSKGGVLDAVALGELNTQLNTPKNLGNGSFIVQLEPIPISTSIKVKSIGTVGNIQEQVSLQLKESDYQTPYMGIYATKHDPSGVDDVAVKNDIYGTLNITGGSSYWTNVGLWSRGKIEGIISIASGKSESENPTLEIPPSPIFPALTVKNTALNRTLNNPTNHNGDYGDETLTMGTLTPAFPNSYLIDVTGDKDLKLRFNKLKIESGTIITIKGNGTVSIFAEEFETATGSVTIQRSDIANVVLYVNSKINISVNGSTAFNGLIIYAPNAEMSTTVNGTFSYSGGSIVVKKLHNLNGTFNYSYDHPEGQTIKGWKNYKPDKWLDE
jgi:hypothetical protein